VISLTRSQKTETVQLRIKSPPRSAWPRRLLLFFLVSFIFATPAYIFRAPLLRGAARLWIVNEPPTRADAIVVLGGGVETRPFEAARLYHSGYAPRILITQLRLDPTHDLGLTTPDHDIARKVLLKQGVPESALIAVGQGVRNTYEEALAVGDWVKENSASHIIIPTDIFHTRRSRWIFRKTLKGLGTQVTVDAVPVREYTADEWWKDERGIVAFQNEVLKFCYYLLKY
jgi:uncharacterized SAM-binding protein YcdF (DUF218 family)